MSDQFIALLEVELDQSTYNRADQLIKQIAKTHRIDLDSGEFNKNLDNLNRRLTSIDSLIDSINNKKLALGGSGNSSLNIGFDQKQLKKMTNAFGTLNATIKTIQQSLGGLGKNSGLGNVTKDLSDAAKKIGDAFDKINNSGDLTQLNQHLGSLQTNLSNIEGLLNGLGGQANLQNLAQSFRDLSVEINQAMSACVNVRNALNNGRNAISEMDNVTIDASQHTNALETAMRGLNINQNEINEATQRLRDMDITVLTVTKHIQDLANGGRAIDFVIRGVDQHGQSVTATQKYRQRVNRNGQTTETNLQDFRITQTVGNTAEEIDDVADAYDRMTEARRRMAEATQKQVGKDPLLDQNVLVEARRQYDAAHREYQELSRQYWHRFTQDQQRSLRTLRDDSRQAIRYAQAAYQDEQFQIEPQRHAFETEVKAWASENTEAAKAFSSQLTEIQNKIQHCDKQSLGHLKAEFNDLKKTASAQGFLPDKKSAKLDVDKRAFSASIDVWSKQNSKAAEHYKDRIAAIRTELQECDAVRLSQLKTEMTTLKREAQAAGLTVKSFGDEVRDLAKRFVGFFTLDRLVDYAVDGIRDMYQQVLEIDTAMTDLLKVTDETSQRYQEFMKNASGTAKELGRSMSGYITQTAEWAKTGYSMDESEQLAKISSIYANVGDVDDSTAVSDMVTAMKAYRIEASEAIRIVDTLNKLGNEFAVTAKGLGAGMANSASAMALSNTTFEQTMALLTGISEITQSPDEAGSFLKVASMRLRGMKGELEALGEEVDSSVDSISKVQTQILNLTHGKVNIFDGAGEFRNYYEIMKDISDVYDELTSTEQSSLTEILFGKMRGNQGAAMIQAFKSGQIEKAFEAAKNSAGSAMAEQEKWMESLEARIGKLTAAWQSFSESFLKSDFLKLLIDGVTGLLDILEKSVDQFGSIPTVITGIVAGLSAFKNVGERIKQFRSEIHIGTRICPRNLLLMVT